MATRSETLVKAAELRGMFERQGAVVVEPPILQPAETLLHESLEGLKSGVADNIAMGDYAAALSKLASLQAPVNAFFEDVMVNAENPDIRDNRHELLAALRNAFTGIADFALLGGASK